MNELYFILYQKREVIRHWEDSKYGEIDNIFVCPNGKVGFYSSDLGIGIFESIEGKVINTFSDIIFIREDNIFMIGGEGGFYFIYDNSRGGNIQIYKVDNELKSILIFTIDTSQGKFNMYSAASVIDDVIILKPPGRDNKDTYLWSISKKKIVSTLSIGNIEWPLRVGNDLLVYNHDEGQLINAEGDILKEYQMTYIGYIQTLPLYSKEYKEMSEYINSLFVPYLVKPLINIVKKFVM